MPFLNVSFKARLPIFPSGIPAQSTSAAGKSLQGPPCKISKTMDSVSIAIASMIALMLMWKAERS